jgi:hypothetical protein
MLYWKELGLSLKTTENNLCGEVRISYLKLCNPKVANAEEI